MLLVAMMDGLILIQWRGFLLRYFVPQQRLYPSMCEFSFDERICLFSSSSEICSIS